MMKMRLIEVVISDFLVVGMETTTEKEGPDHDSDRKHNDERKDNTSDDDDCDVSITQSALIDALKVSLLDHVTLVKIDAHPADALRRRRRETVSESRV